MNILLYTVTYASILIFFAACVTRVLQYSRTPIHLRWELYPVPHEEPNRVEYGGSSFEIINWWTKPTPHCRWGEWKFMVPEIIFLRGLWEYNRRLWICSFPFHFGLYLLILTVALLAACGIISAFSPILTLGRLGVSLRSLYPFTGATGLVLGLLGAFGLLVSRLTNSRLKILTTPGDIFNLLFFVVTFGILSAGFMSNPAPAPDMLDLTLGILTFNLQLKIPGLLTAGLLMAGLLVAYIPMTHMSHFIAKYFTYHSVRWDDASNRRGGKIEARLAECLAYKPTWSAAHMKADGRKTWAEIASINPAQEAKK
jgi:nitrate reductase gamma subunit